MVTYFTLNLFVYVVGYCSRWQALFALCIDIYIYGCYIVNYFLLFLDQKKPFYVPAAYLKDLGRLVYPDHNFFKYVQDTYTIVLVL